MGLQVVTSCSTVSFPVGNAVSFPHDRSRIFLFWRISLSLSRSLWYANDQMYDCAKGACLTEDGGEGFKWTMLEKKHCLLSLSHTHTHTHAHAHAHEHAHPPQTARYGRKRSATLAFQQLRCTNCKQRGNNVQVLFFYFNPLAPEFGI
jgi:hypothetical protein